MKTHDDIFLQHLTPLLEKEGVKFIQMVELTDGEDLSYLKEYFYEYIFPTLTPLAIDAYRPFPMLSNKSLNLFVVLGDHENASNISSFRTKLAIVGVPSVLNRYIELPTQKEQRRFVLIEDVISFFIKSLFNGFNVESVTAFRITRNSDLTVDERGYGRSFT